MKETNIISSVSKKANNFLNSNKAFIFFLGGVVVSSLINVIMFSFNINDFTIDTLWWGSISVNDSNSYIGWIEIIVAAFGSLLTIWGVIWTIRFDKRFIYPLVVGEVLVIIDAIMLGLVFTGLSYVLMVISALYNFFMWNNVDEDNDSKMNLFNWMIIIIFITIYCVGGIILVASVSGKVNGFNIVDIISSGVVAASWFVILRKSKWGFVTFIITDIIYLIVYLSVGVWATACSYAIYMFIDSTSLLSWWEKK